MTRQRHRRLSPVCWRCPKRYEVVFGIKAKSKKGIGMDQRIVPYTLAFFSKWPFSFVLGFFGYAVRDGGKGFYLMSRFVKNKLIQCTHTR